MPHARKQAQKRPPIWEAKSPAFWFDLLLVPCIMFPHFVFLPFWGQTQLTDDISVLLVWGGRELGQPTFRTKTRGRQQLSQGL